MNHDEWLDYNRDRNYHIVYKCPTCGARGIGPIVTLHEHTMVREEINQEEFRKFQLKIKE